MPEKGVMSDTNRAYDLGAWLETADKLGQLKRVEGAGAHLEIGAITELNARTRDRSALLFDRIGGRPDGFRVLTGVLLNPVTVGMTMGIAQQYEGHALQTAGFAALCSEGGHDPEEGARF